MNEVIYAKSKDEETLQQHIEWCLKAYYDLKGHYPALLTEREWDILYYAVKYHDIGKIDRIFQNMIRKKIGLSFQGESKQQFYHEQLSVTLLDLDFFEDLSWEDSEIDMLLLMIYYHHCRDNDITNDQKEYYRSYVETNLTQRCKELGLKNENGLLNEPDTQGIEIRNQLKQESQRFRYMLLKGMLNRIDYCGSAHREKAEEPPAGAPIADCTRAMMQSRGFALRPVQQYLSEHRGENLLVRASTGIGKTEGALLWLGDRKGFYTLPLRVSINAIHHRIKNPEDINYPSVALLHGDAKAYYKLNQDDEEENSWMERWEAVRLFTAPLTVCTVDQIIRFVYKAKGTEIAAAVLAGACLILDEIQMYQPEQLAAIIYGLKIITALGGRFLILTATFPKLLTHFIEKEEIPMTIAPQVYHCEITKRHRMKLLKTVEFPFEDILKQGETRRVLVLCNTVKKAQDVYDKLDGRGVPVWLLHSRYIRKDRQLLEEKILAFAPNKKDRAPAHGIWVSTQIVEASLDLDFDILYTSMCTVDSLLQRMGRVYRSRWYDLDEEPNVYVVKNRDGVGNKDNAVVPEQLYDFSLIAIQDYDGKLLEESDESDLKSAMMDEVYDLDKNPELLGSDYYKRVSDELKVLKNSQMYQREPQNAKFRDIDSQTVIPLPVYQKLIEEEMPKKWLSTVQNGETPEERYKARLELMKYTVSVREQTDSSRQEFWSGSKIPVVSGAYDFDEATGKGLGFQVKKRQKTGICRQQSEALML